MRLSSYLLILFGLAALGYTAYVYERAQSYQKNASRDFESARATIPAPAAMGAPSPVAPAEVVPAPKLEGSLIGRLEVPRLGVSVMVAEGDSNTVLRRAVGHLSGTPLPGDIGNVALAGHRDTFFRPLRNIRTGDLITIETLNHKYEYQVEWFKVVSPENVSVLAPSESRELTLVTCFPFYYVGSAPDRFVVRAREVEGQDTRAAGEMPLGAAGGGGETEEK